MSRVPRLVEGAEFAIEDTDNWAMLMVGRGTIVEVLLPDGMFGLEVGVWAGFLVLDTSVHRQDASVLREVKS